MEIKGNYFSGLKINTISILLKVTFSSWKDTTTLSNTILKFLQFFLQATSVKVWEFQICRLWGCSILKTKKKLPWTMRHHFFPASQSCSRFLKIMETLMSKLQFCAIIHEMRKVINHFDNYIVWLTNNPCFFYIN